MQPLLPQLLDLSSQAFCQPTLALLWGWARYASRVVGLLVLVWCRCVMAGHTMSKTCWHCSAAHTRCKAPALLCSMGA
jgi:hypothetical protein